MFAKKNTSSKIDPEQRDLIEKAQSRARQKKKLYLHFLFFLIGAVILICLNVFFDIGKEVKPFGIDWFVWAIGIWGIIFLLHLFNVFVTNKFLGKEWEERQVEKLVAKQQKRIEELQLKVDKQHPLPKQEKPWVESKNRIDPDAPINT